MNRSGSAATAQVEASELLEVDAPDSFFRHAWNELRKRKLALFAVCVLLFLYTLGIFAPVVATHDYSETNLG